MDYMEGFDISPEYERLLHQTEIDEQSPGTVLHDFGAFLAYIENNEVPLTGKHHFPLKVLRNLNPLLAHPLQIGLTRPRQKSYPHINGLYLLLRASGLTAVRGTDRKPQLELNPEVHPIWATMNPTERYCTLLESWLVRGFPQIIGERDRNWGGVPDNFRELLWFYLRLPQDKVVIAEDPAVEESLHYWPGLYNLALLELFGLIDIRHQAAEPGEGWRIETIERNPLGLAMLAVLRISFFGNFDRLLDVEDEDRIPIGVLQPVLQPYFPAWRKNLSLPEWTFRQGVHVFKVSLGRMWRSIALPADLTLDDLARATLNAVGFDHDHLYEFTYQGRLGTQEEAHHPYMDDGPWASEVAIGDVPLRLGQTMTFLYDFGDMWRFTVTLERVDPGMDVQEATLIGEHGSAPEQYNYNW